MPDKSLKRRASLVEDSNDSDAPLQVSKKSKGAAATGEPAGKDDDGNAYWELSNKRRVGLSQFKQSTFINIREFYEKDGKTLPGKKGISLSIEQYAALLKAVPGINAALREAGHEANGLDDDAVEAPVPKSKEKSKPAKANIEATSDEESD